jgi:hypothetical protein
VQNRQFNSWGEEKEKNHFKQLLSRGKINNSTKMFISLLNFCCQLDSPINQ